MLAPGQSSMVTESVTDARVACLLELFANRRDTVAVLASWGKPAPIPVKDDAQLESIVRSHLTGSKVAVQESAEKKKTVFGQWRVGFYCPTPGDSLTRWTCVDVDGGGGTHKTGVKDARLAVTRITRRADLLGVSVHVERSGGGSGFHVWTFYSEPIPAKIARDLGLALCPPDIELERPTPRGGHTTADARRNRGLEVFPKTTNLDAGGTGGMVWLPWWHKAEGDANQFVDPRKDLEVLEDCAFAQHSGAQVASALEKASSWRKPERELRNRLDSPEWRGFKLEVCEKLDLSSVYGDFLTGKRTGADGGWLQCRDPESPSGDRNPSAGVADGAPGYLRGSFHSFITGETKLVFRFMVENGLATSYADADKVLSRLTGVPLPIRTRPISDVSTIPSAPVSDSTSRSPRPQLTTHDTYFGELERESWEALVEWNRTPKLFRRGDAVVSLALDQRGRLGFRRLTIQAMRSYLDAAAQWFTPTAEANKPTWPPEAIARVMLEQGYERLPPIDRIVRAPFFDADLNLVATPGYHRRPQVWFDEAGGVSVGDLPENPDEDLVGKAAEFVIDELFTDFEFVSAADGAHVFAALLQPIVREAIPGPTPLYLVEAPKTGTGKSAVCEIVAILATGRRLASRSFTTDDIELDKRILGELLAGSELVCFDNAPERRTLTAVPLMNVLTSDAVTGRPLGGSRLETAMNRALWMLTANNPRLSSEFVRRCVRIRMDTGLERPQARGPSSFRHADLFGWTLANRHRLLRALIVLVLYWRSKGAPRGSKSKASFNDWAGVIGGIMEACCLPGFLENEDDFFEDVDAEADEWGTFVRAWAEAKPIGQTFTASELCRLADTKDLLAEVRVAGNERANVVRVGKALASHRDQVFGEFKITRCGLSSGTRLWKLERTSED